MPALPEDGVLSRLLFGTSVANLSATEALQLAAAAASLRSGGRSAGNPLNKLGRAIGVDRIRVRPGHAQNRQSNTVAAGNENGKRVSRKGGGEGKQVSRRENPRGRRLS